MWAIFENHWDLLLRECAIRRENTNTPLTKSFKKTLNSQRTKPPPSYDLITVIILILK